MSKETKLSKAVEIVKANREAKGHCLQVIMSTLGVTKSNAFVYYTKAIKSLDGVPQVASKRETKVSEITETSPVKKAKKINEIDAFIQSVKQAAGTTSPFSGLGV